MSGRPRRILALAGLAALCACSQPALPAAHVLPPDSGAARAARSYAAQNDIPPRLQWEANDGYCGEVSTISAGLYYGQYVSQYDARAIASPGVPQYEASSQLLLDANDRTAATAMHLTWEEWKADGPSPKKFLAWVERQVALGHPVAIGVYNNEYLLYGKTGPQAGSVSYDHIVPVVAVTSSRPLDGSYDPSAVLTFSDNGLWGTHGNYPYLFRYAFGSFQRTRKEANARRGPLYGLPDRIRNYGIAITGIVDDGKETLPVRVATSLNYERPSIVNGTSKRPAPMPLVLTATVSGLTPGVRYRLYRYDGFSSVPDGEFNARAAAAAQRWTFSIASGSTYSLSQRVMSDQEVIYRAVPAAAP